MLKLKRAIIFILPTALITLSALHYSASSSSHLTISGLHGAALKNLKKRLKIDKAQLIKRIKASGTDELNIDSLVYGATAPFGYFNAKGKFIAKHKNHRVSYSVAIQAGVQSHITQLHIQLVGAGSSKAFFTDYLKKIPMKVGAAFNAADYQQTKATLSQIANDYGYFQAAFSKHDIVLDPKTHHMHINLVFDTGPRFQFAITRFTKTKLDLDFLQKFLHYQPGQPYQAAKIKKLQDDLTHSNYFKSVSISTVPNNKTHRVQTEVHLVPNPSQQYQFGAGYGTNTGVRGSINLNMPILNAHGHQFKTSISASQKSDSLTASYLIPGQHPAYSHYRFSAAIASTNISQGKGRNIKLDADYTTQLFGWKQTMGLTVLRERYQLERLPYLNSHMVIPNIHWQKRVTNSILRPSNGFLMQLDVSGASQSLLSRDSFFQTKFYAKILKTFWRGTRLLFNAKLALTDIDDLEKLPLSLQLFAGGTDSLRGYGFQSIGPGRKLLTSSIEIQQKIISDWYLAAFFDMGNVSNGLAGRFKKSAGPGIVWLSPLGAMELTIAKPIHERNSHWRFQFRMGPEI